MSFYTDVIQTSAAFHSNKRYNKLDLLEPETRRKVQAIISDAKSHGKEMQVYETYRSVNRQEELFQQGATKLRNVGCHHYGIAADIVFVVNGEPSWDGDYSLLFHLAIAHKLVSGSNWHYPNPPKPHGFVDLDHVQRVRLEDQDKLFAGTWYPPAEYTPF